MVCLHSRYCRKTHQIIHSLHLNHNNRPTRVILSSSSQLHRVRGSQRMCDLPKITLAGSGAGEEPLSPTAPVCKFSEGHGFYAVGDRHRREFPGCAVAVRSVLCRPSRLLSRAPVPSSLPSHSPVRILLSAPQCQQHLQDYHVLKQNCSDAVPTSPFSEYLLVCFVF